MSAFLLRRFGQALLLLFIVSMIGFAILHLAPGGPMSQFAAGGDMSQEDLDRIAEQLGLNRPLPVQYAEWLWRMLGGDWGRSYRDGQPVVSIIASHVGATFQLMLTSTLLAMLIGAWVGILGAIGGIAGDVTSGARIAAARSRVGPSGPASQVAVVSTESTCRPKALRRTTMSMPPMVC